MLDALTFTDSDYDNLGTWIKWNPAIKTITDQNALWVGLLDNYLDIIASDHAPHTILEKDQNYIKAPAGGPLVQHSLLVMLDHMFQGKIKIEDLVYKMCHAPAICFKIAKRGFIREGYYADMVILDSHQPG